jgi:5,6,7,8-tetrahydromethanopterin hydro-lyase
LAIICFPQRGAAKAVVESVKAGIIPTAEADNMFICVGVFIYREARDDTKIQDWNYEATKLAIAHVVKGEASVADVIARRDTMQHPLAVPTFEEGCITLMVFPSSRIS